MKFKIGDEVIFNHYADAYYKHNNQIAEIVEDKNDFGYPYKIKFSNGTTIPALEKELNKVTKLHKALN